MNNDINGIKNGERIIWPNGSKIAVMLTFEFEAETLRMSQLARQGRKPGAGELEQGRYGANEGIWRCLRMLDTNNIKSTFFIPGYVIERYKEIVKEINLRGHEIAYHGYMHEPDRDTSREEEEEKMEQAEILIKEITGRRPVGYRAPHSTLHKDAFDLMTKRNYLYSSNLRDCDWAYLHKFANRKPLVEIPTDVILDDFTYYYYSLDIEPGHRVPFTNQEFVTMLKEEFDALALENDKVLCIKLHPQLIGRPGRIKILSDFVGYMKQHGAWITTCENVAKYVIETNTISKRS